MKKILVVDDDVDITTSVKNGIQPRGLWEDKFKDPKEALRSFSTGAYDAAILDISMPNLNGFELFREFKRMYD